MQVDPDLTPSFHILTQRLLSRDFQRSKLKHDKLLSNVASKLQPALLHQGYSDEALKRVGEVSSGGYKLTPKSSSRKSSVVFS